MRKEPKSQAKLMEYQGEIHSLSFWADKLGITRQQLWRRFRRGFNFADAIEDIKNTNPKHRESRLRKKSKIIWKYEL
jgi:hypothetical protein